jgi:CDP-4-dehydro-6-deoxyglucose reductase
MDCLGKFKITLQDGKTFPCDKGLSLLDAAVAAGIVFPYSCRTGRCSTCKCKIISGSTDCINAELGLSQSEEASGWILTCVRTPLSDLVIDANVLEDLEIPDPRTLPCRIHDIQYLAPDVLIVKLRLPPSAEFHFLPGQYIDLIGPGGDRRSYSLANSDATDKMLELHIRSVKNGLFSTYWFETAKVNDLLRLHGPLGTFFLRGVREKDLVFLATGTGLAPVKSILGSLSKMSPKDWPKTVSVYWGGRISSDLYWNLDFPIKSLSYFPVLSRPEPSWVGDVGYVQDVLISKHNDLSNMMVYACGSDAMIKSAEIRLSAAGLPEGCFMSDAFVCSARL